MTPPGRVSAADSGRTLLLECRLEQMRSALDEAREQADLARQRLAEATAREADHARRYAFLQEEVAEARAEILGLYRRLEHSDALRAEVAGALFEDGAVADLEELVRLRREVVEERQRAALAERSLARFRGRAQELLASRELVLARIAEWQRQVRDEDPEAADLAEFIAELRAEILEMERRGAETERREAALRARLSRLGVDPDGDPEQDDDAAARAVMPAWLERNAGEAAAHVDEAPLVAVDGSDEQSDTAAAEHGLVEAAGEWTDDEASLTAAAQEEPGALELPMDAAEPAYAEALVAAGSLDVAQETALEEEPAAEEAPTAALELAADDEPTAALEPAAEEAPTAAPAVIAEAASPTALGPTPADEAVDAEEVAPDTEEATIALELSTAEESPTTEDLAAAEATRPAALTGEVEHIAAEHIAAEHIGAEQIEIAALTDHEESSDSAERTAGPEPTAAAALSDEAEPAAAAEPLEHAEPVAAAELLDHTESASAAEPPPAMGASAEADLTDEAEPAAAAPSDQAEPAAAAEPEPAPEPEPVQELLTEEARARSRAIAADLAAVGTSRRADLLLRLGRSGDAAAVSPIRFWTDAPESAVRAAAYEALGRLLEAEPRGLESVLRRGLADRDPRVRRRVVLAAATASRIDLRTLLASVRQDPDAQVRRVVREVMRQAPPPTRRDTSAQAPEGVQRDVQRA